MAERFLHELEIYGGLEVCLVPAPDAKHSTHSIRVACSQNPPWYRRFAAKYENCRGRGRKQMKRPRTFIDRRLVPAALQRIIDGRPSGVYCERLLTEIELTIAREKPSEPDDGFEFGEGGIWF